MNGTTHAIFGVAALAGASLAVGTEPSLYAYPAAVVAAWLPDVDNPRSTLGNGLSRMKNPVLNLVTRPLSWFLRTASFFLVRTVGHRTLTHSLLGAAIFCVPVWMLLGGWLPGVALALISGYVSHIVADALNRWGVPLLWPLGIQFRLFPGGLRSGGVAELVVAALVLVLAGVEIYLLHPSVEGLF